MDKKFVKFGQKFKSSGLDYNIFFTSDLHFWHENVLKFCPATRPWKSVEKMNQGLIDHWNSLVSDEDIVFVLGDFSFGNKQQTEEILSQLNGHIVHLYGNHSKTLRTQFKDLIAFDYLEISYDGFHLVLNHYAQRVWNRSHYGSGHCFGHSHGSLEGVGRSMDVGWDAQGRLLTIKEVVDMLKSKEIYCEDGH